MHKVLKIYVNIVNAIVIGLILVMLATLVFAFADILTTLFNLIPNLKNVTLNDVQFRDLVTGILDVFIIIELFGSIIDYIHLRRIRLSALIDVVAVFVLRHMIERIYAETAQAEALLELALLLLVLVVARSITGRFPPNTGRD
ncbi:hypothetical protein U879_09990 [Defluviimonas sp. 20V17]|uniref:Uncharacterized membrane protein, DUF373 family n=1 Tax=Allgaiera indica TaxID=765699 RepID=A0AAN4UPT2_9RHOB|nr:phosphate-starvation-inducible PsiE family protein [Allgaiera indica]KDB03880.1 hypothetical protein U879_09990 [Defluviimonas sp. 20V17]GHE00086.1 hypothetical protein GCM10008024_10390 [Allgaiera indica]SDW37413.1 Uncharacterized membrane protein, DUF373 family [Allgaiera indica]